MSCVLGSFNALLRELVAEFTLTDNSANTTTSLLRSLCHYDDSVLLGSWLQETDHKSIEDQVIRKQDSNELSAMSPWVMKFCSFFLDILQRFAKFSFHVLHNVLIKLPADERVVTLVQLGCLWLVS